MDSAATRVSCAIQLEIGRGFLEPVPCKGNTPRHGRTGTFFLKRKNVDDLDHVVPLTVFTDAGPLILQKSCVVVGFSSLLAQGHEKLAKYLCGSCVKQSGGPVDIGACDRLIADLLALTTGVVGGSPIAVGDNGSLWRFLLFFTKCDEETRCNEFGMTHYNGADEVCSKCLANRNNRLHRHARGCSMESHRGTTIGLLQGSPQTPFAPFAQQPVLQ